MRSIFRDFSYDYFDILAHPKEQWYDFWQTYREKHPKVLQEYMLKNNLNESTLKEKLESLERRELDKLSQYWQRVGAIEKAKVLKTLGKRADALHLEREDFVIHILGGLGEREHFIIPTSKGNVVMIDLLGCWLSGKIEDFPSIVFGALDDFIEYSHVHVRHFMSDDERRKRFSLLLHRLPTELRDKTFDEKLATIACFLDKYVEHYNWSGFYLTTNDRLLSLGAFVGEPTEHLEIPFGSGICGQAAETMDVFVVPDVSKEENYLACSLKTKSEIVIPLIKEGQVIGELDIDSHFPNGFGASDREFLEKVCEALIRS